MFEAVLYLNTRKTNHSAVIIILASDWLDQYLSADILIGQHKILQTNQLTLV